MSGSRGIRIAHELVVFILASLLALVMLLTPPLLVVLRGGPRARMRIDLAELPPAPRAGRGVRARAEQIAYVVRFRYLAEERAVLEYSDAAVFSQLSAQNPYRRPGDGTRARADASASAVARQLAAMRSAGEQRGEPELLELLRAAELLAAAAEACSEPAYVAEELQPPEARAVIAAVETPPKPPIEPRVLVRAPRAPGRAVPA